MHVSERATTAILTDATEFSIYSLLSFCSAYKRWSSRHGRYLCHKSKRKCGFVLAENFLLLNDTLKLGSKQPLDDSLLFPVGTFDKAERLMTELEREWLAEERATVHQGKKSHLWRAMMRTTSQRDYIILALLRLCDSLIFNALPFLIWYLLKSISTGSGISYKTFLPFVTGISLATITRTALLTQAYFKVGTLAIRPKFAVVGLVYKKVGNPVVI